MRFNSSLMGIMRLITIAAPETVGVRTELQASARIRKPQREALKRIGFQAAGRRTCCQTVAKREAIDDRLCKSGASEGIRTLDTHVGNVMLYQAELRSLPVRRGKATGILPECKSGF
jgi:hypothetical protein